MKMSLDEMATFVKVVDCGNFSKAAALTGIPVSTVSRRIADLEKRLSVQLLQRTTRQQRLTDIGNTYYEHCSRMLAEAEAAELAVQNLQAEPSGVLRLTAPMALDDPFSSRMIISFLQKYPKVRVESMVNARQVDLIEERYDCGLYAGSLQDSSLISRHFGSVKMIYCASPEYIDSHGLPVDEHQLQGHHLARFDFPEWLQMKRDVLISKVESRHFTNDIVVARRAAIDGIGITRLPEVQILRNLEKGELVEVLPHLASAENAYIVFPSNKQFTTKLRAFIDHAIEFSINNAPWDFH